MSTGVVGIAIVLLQGTLSSERSLTNLCFALVYYLFAGAVEHFSHYFLDDLQRGNIITKGKVGVDRVLSVLIDVILPGPIAFLHLTLIDYGLFAKITKFAAATSKGAPAFRWAQRGPVSTAAADEEQHVRFDTERLDPRDMRDRADDFYSLMSMRRSLRFYSLDPVPEGIIERCIETATTAPSGAHKQPWTFVLIRDAAKKVRTEHFPNPFSINECVCRLESASIDKSFPSVPAVSVF